MRPTLHARKPPRTKPECDHGGNTHTVGPATIEACSTQADPTPATRSLRGKRGLIVGVANQQSIAYGCARAMHALGADLLLTCHDTHARDYVVPLSRALGVPPPLLLDVEDPATLDAVFEVVAERWGQLDFVVHSVAYANPIDLHRSLVDCSSAGFLQAMAVSCYSFIDLARRARPLMRAGGTLICMSYEGAQRAVEHYNVMGPAKAALESSVRYLAHDLGTEGIRVHAISPGPIATRAASGIQGFDQLLAQAAHAAPIAAALSPDDVGWTAAFLASDAARCLSGSVIYVDGGAHVV